MLIRPTTVHLSLASLVTMQTALEREITALAKRGRQSPLRKRLETAHDELSRALATTSKRRDRVGAVGQDTGLVDKRGRPVHVGDTLEFDEKEFGAPCTFVLEYDTAQGSLSMPGAVGDLDEYCVVTKRFDE